MFQNRRIVIDSAPLIQALVGWLIDDENSPGSLFPLAVTIAMTVSELQVKTNNPERVFRDQSESSL
jgi:hypothetical protein